MPSSEKVYEIIHVHCSFIGKKTRSPRTSKVF